MDYGMTSHSELLASTRSADGLGKTKSTRYQTLDHWRGLACLIIVIHHALLPMCDYSISEVAAVSTASSTNGAEAASSIMPAPAGASSVSHTNASKVRNWLVARLRVGVQFFFVISGYCIAATAWSLVNQGAPIKSYFRRRLVRILPAYWVALLGSVLACFVIESINPGVLQQLPWSLTMPWNLSPIQWVSSITLTEAWVSYALQTSPEYFPIQAWTLCYELQFYVVFGVLLACSGHRFFRTTALFTLAIVVIDLLLLNYHVRIRGLFFDEHWFMFAVGIGLFWDLNQATAAQAIRCRIALALAMAGLATLALTTSLFGINSQFSAWRIIEAVAFAGLLLGLKRYDDRIARMKGLRWLKSCGVMSYSIYLTHLFPVKFLSQQLIAAGFSDDLSLVLVCIPLVLLLSISMGYIFHVLVERRFLTETAPQSRVVPSDMQPILIPLHGVSRDVWPETGEAASVAAVIQGTNGTPRAA